MFKITRWVTAVAAVVLLGTTTALATQPSFITFESGPVRPIAMSPDGSTLFVVNIPDNRLEVFSIAGGSLTHIHSIPVGMEPVAVAAHSDDEVWVVNHLSDSISVVDVTGVVPRVVRTLLVGDEPNDIVFAGPAMNLFLPVVVFVGMQAAGMPRADAVIGTVELGSPAADAGEESDARGAER